MGFRTNGNLDQNRKQAFCHENGNSNKWESWTGKTKNEAPSPLPQLSQARLASANCVRVVCGCCSAFAEHFSKQCLLGLKFETKQNSQTWFWEMYRRGRVATAHHAEAVGEQQANLGKQRGCFILRISGKTNINVALFFLVLVQLCMQTTFALFSGAHCWKKTCEGRIPVRKHPRGLLVS